MSWGEHVSEHAIEKEARRGALDDHTHATRARGIFSLFAPVPPRQSPDAVVATPLPPPSEQAINARLDSQCTNDNPPCTCTLSLVSQARIYKFESEGDP